MAAFHPIPDIPAPEADTESCRTAGAPIADFKDGYLCRGAAGALSATFDAHSRNFATASEASR